MMYFFALCIVYDTFHYYLIYIICSIITYWPWHEKTWPIGYKTFFMLTTIIGILTFISMINTTTERLKQRCFFICRYFSFCEQLKFRAQLS